MAQDHARSRSAGLLATILAAVIGAIGLGVFAEVSGNLPWGAFVSEAGGPWFALAYAIGAWSSARRIPVVLIGAAAIVLALAANIGYRAAVHGPDAVDHFIRYLAPLWFPFAAAVGAVFTCAGIAVRTRKRPWTACGGGVFIAALLLDSVVTWERYGTYGLAVVLIDALILVLAVAHLGRRVELRWLLPWVAGWLIAGATLGVVAYDRVLGGLN